MRINQGSFAAFLNDEEGGLPSLEFIMVSIPMILVSFCLIQFMLMANAVIVMKGAAHAAARSALVHKCRPQEADDLNIFGAVADSIFGNCSDKPDEWKDAAKIALIPIAPSSDKVKSRTSCQHPTALLKMMKGAVKNKTGIHQIFENKACYVFEPGNVDVKVKWLHTAGGFSLHYPPELEVTVKFKLEVLTPVRMIFRTGQRSDNTSYWEGETTVTYI